MKSGPFLDDLQYLHMCFSIAKYLDCQMMPDVSHDNRNLPTSPLILLGIRHDSAPENVSWCPWKSRWIIPSPQIFHAEIPVKNLRYLRFHGWFHAVNFKQRHRLTTNMRWTIFLNSPLFTSGRKSPKSSSSKPRLRLSTWHFFKKSWCSFRTNHQQKIMFFSHKKTGCRADPAGHH